MVEGARLESVFRGNSNVGSNPTLSAILEINGLRASSCNIVQAPTLSANWPPEIARFVALISVANGYGSGQLSSIQSPTLSPKGE